MQKQQPNETLAFIREHRSNESNFEALCQKLDEIAGKANGDYRQGLLKAKEKAEVYRKTRETGGTAWPEFEGFVTEFERTVTNTPEGE